MAGSVQHHSCAWWVKEPCAFFVCLKLACVCLVEPLSSVSSLEVHFDLLDLTELTDMSDQELAEVFADSDEENHNEPRAGKPVCLGTEIFTIYNKFKGPPNSNSMKVCLNTAHSLSDLKGSNTVSILGINILRVMSALPTYLTLMRILILQVSSQIMRKGFLRWQDMSLHPLHLGFI